MEEATKKKDETAEEVKEIVSIFLELPKTDRAILLNTANGFKTLRRIEKSNRQEVS